MNTINAPETPAYAIAYLREVDFGPALVAYLEKIDATLDAFEGRFLVHGGELQPIEGQWDGTLIVIEFPDLAAAQKWYASEPYQEILPLRLDHTHSIATLVEGVPKGYRATDGLAVLLAG